MLASASADFAALWPALLARAEAEAEAAPQKLAARGDLEARSLRSIIEAQRGRIERSQLLSFGFENPSAARQSSFLLPDHRRRLRSVRGLHESQGLQGT